MSAAERSGNPIEFRNGYETYKRGHKISSAASSAFREGWWTARDNGERFGIYASFLDAPNARADGGASL